MFLSFRDAQFFAVTLIRNRLACAPRDTTLCTQCVQPMQQIPVPTVS